MIISGPNSNIQIESDIDRNEINTSKLYLEYKDAFANQIAKAKKGYKSIYEDSTIVP